MNAHRRLRLATLVATVATATVLAGCSLDSSWRPLAEGPGVTSGAGATLTPVQAADAVIGLTDLGDGFMVDPDDGDEGGSLGCLDDIDKMAGSVDGSGPGPGDALAEHDAQYKATGDLGLPFVLSSVTGMRSAGEVRTGLSRVEDALKDCRTVDTTDSDGARTQLTITTDRTAGEGTAAQLNITAIGHLSLAGPGGQVLTVPFYLRVSLAQVGDNLATVGYGSMVEPAEGDTDATALDAYAVARLRAVMAGTPTPPAPDLGLRRITQGDLLAGLTGQGSDHDV